MRDKTDRELAASMVAELAFDLNANSETSFEIRKERLAGALVRLLDEERKELSKDAPEPENTRPRSTGEERSIQQSLLDSAYRFDLAARCKTCACCCKDSQPRLRAALREILDLWGMGHAIQIGEIARAALKTAEREP